MTDTWVHAIPALLIRGDVRGRKRLQKLLYFLQEAEGQPLGLDYRMHYYGPYSPTLDARIQLLAARGLVEETTPADGVSKFSLSAGAEAQLGRTPPSLHESIDRVLEHFGRLTPNAIELLATVHFLAQGRREVGDELEGKLVDEVNAWKRPKYSRGQIVSAVRRLGELGYIR